MTLDLGGLRVCFSLDMFVRYGAVDSEVLRRNYAMKKRNPMMSLVETTVVRHDIVPVPFGKGR